MLYSPRMFHYCDTAAKEILVTFRSTNLLNNSAVEQTIRNLQNMAHEAKDYDEQQVKDKNELRQTEAKGNSRKER